MLQANACVWLIGKILRSRRWRVADHWRKVMGSTMYLREHDFPNVSARVTLLTPWQLYAPKARLGRGLALGPKLN